MDIGKRIKEIRLSNNISARQLALNIGVTPAQISKIENGRGNPSIEILIRICQILDISLSDFFADEEPTQSPEIIRLVKAAEKLSPQQIELVTALVNELKNKQ